MIKKFLYLIILICFAPFIMWLLWFLTPKKKLVAAIVDKTVLTQAGQEHSSLYWILNQERFSKTSTKSYSLDRDYFGFFPLDDEKYKIKGLERFSNKQITQLSKDADLLYFTDTYGIYNNEWYQKKDITERSGMLYGGLSAKDVQLARLMKNQNKLIIAEFNTIGDPTDSAARSNFEQEFAIKWTGWTARHFESLDTAINMELPHWLINNYKKTHQSQWPFKKAGIAFVSNDDRVVILEDSVHLSNPMPHIQTDKAAQENFGLPSEVRYPFWFDIIEYDAKVNKSAANFKISMNGKGLAELKSQGIPAVFPAITYHKGKDYQFYYFSGDFCDNPVSINSSYFKGIGYFKWMFYDDRNPMERRSFFWNYYRPLISTILEEYSESRK